MSYERKALTLEERMLESARKVHPQTFDESMLRDLFAAAAMAGMLAQGPQPNVAATAYVAYEFADAMMERRKAQGTDAAQAGKE